MLPYAKRVNFIFIFRQGDINQIILRLSIISYSLPDLLKFNTYTSSIK